MRVRATTISMVDLEAVEVTMPSRAVVLVSSHRHHEEESFQDAREYGDDDDDEYYSVTSFDSAWLNQEILKAEELQDEDDAVAAMPSNPTTSTASSGSQQQPADNDNHKSPRGMGDCIVRFHRTVRIYWRNHRVTCIWLLLYASANVAMFYYKASIYAFEDQHATPRKVFGSCVIVARGAAMCLNLNACLILLPLCRHLWTFVQGLPPLRLCCASSKKKKPKRIYWTEWLPLDQWMVIHRVIGILFLYWTLLHCAAHACDFYRFAHYPYEQDLYLLFPHEHFIPTDPGGRWRLLLRQPAAITGILMAFCILVAYPCVIWYRKLGYNVFWYSHHLLLVMVVALLFHGMGSLLEPPQSIYWVGVPLCLYILPRLWREVAVLFCASSKVQVLELSVKPGNVILLRLTKPSSWKNRLRAGMYANLNIPYLSLLEWHAFTISSAPSDDFLEFHIRPVGDWTTELYQLAQSFTPATKHAAALSPTFESLAEAGLCSSFEDEPMPSEASMKCIKEDNDGMNTSNLSISQRWLWDRGASVIDLSNVMMRDASSADTAPPPSAMSSTSNLSSSSTTNNNNHNNHHHHDHHHHIKKKRSTSKEPFPLKQLVVKLDGPLGTASQGYSQHRMVVLVGAGIGITPMVSVLKELLANPGKMERTYLIWSFRERRAMDWFANLINDVLLRQQQQQQQSRRRHQRNSKPTPVLQLRFFVTKAPHREACVSRNQDFTVVYGRRPCWYDELTRIQRHIRAQDHNKCGVFCCGPTAMTQRIREVGFQISRQDPDFHFFCRQETFAL